MFAYRIADARHAIFDAAGAMLHGGRWNSIGQSVIYAAETYAGALLEVMVHANLAQAPRNHCVVCIDIPDAVTIENVSPEALKGWQDEDMIASRAFGDRWIRESRSAVLRVPSVITGGRESNLVFNTQHPQFTLISAGLPEPVQWDRRMFR